MRDGTLSCYQSSLALLLYALRSFVKISINRHCSLSSLKDSNYRKIACQSMNGKRKCALRVILQAENNTLTDFDTANI